MIVDRVKKRLEAENMLKLIEALQKGRELANPATWKNRQSTMNLVVAVMSLITFGLRLAGVDLQLTDDQLAGIAEAIDRDPRCREYVSHQFDL